MVGCGDDDDDSAGTPATSQKAEEIAALEERLTEREAMEAANPDDYRNVNNLTGEQSQWEALYDNVEAAPGDAAIGFLEVPAPATDQEKRSVLASGVVGVKSSPTKMLPSGFNIILRSGDTAGGGFFGLLHDINGNPLADADGSPVISNDNDFSSLLFGKSDGKLYMVSHFENYDVGTMYITELNQDAETGMLSAVRTAPIDFSGVKGGWIHCAGSVTPWGTHLGSEEYEPDYSFVDPVTNRYTGWQATDGGTNAVMGAYFGGSAWYANPDAFDYRQVNWYDYGWEVEVTVNSFDDVRVVKHYSMGRVAHELAYVLPDQKTAYISDDGSYVGLFRYVADTAGDLSAGHLYAAKWIQTGTENGGSANLQWIDLGHATDAEIRAYIDARITLSNIFEITPADGTTCPEGYTYTEHTWSAEQDLDGECLLLKEGMEKPASRLETRRYAAYLGATTEWEKMEGITYDPSTRTLYQAMSRVRNGMSDKKGDIQLPLNYCGTVYAMPLDENYVANTVSGEVSGLPRRISRGAEVDNPYPPPFDKNDCDLDFIAEPDNITFMTGYNVLIIGEDTGAGHQNDVIWAYDLGTKKLTRIQTTPYGSETTSPYFYPNINGWAYLMSVIQHPFGESDSDQSTGPLDNYAYTGYIGPLPALK